MSKGCATRLNLILCHYTHLPLSQWKFKDKVAAFSVLCPHSRHGENRRDRFEHCGSQLSMFIRSFSPFPTSTGAELDGECTTSTTNVSMLSGDRSLLLNLRALIISMKRHKSRRYGGSWCAGVGFSFEQKKLILLKTERSTLKAIIG